MPSANVASPVSFGKVTTTTLIGAQKVRNDLREIQLMLLSPDKVLELEFDILEQAEKDLFEQFVDPTYYLSGKLEASLTQRDANGAIRRLHGFAVEFGTSIWYGKFQRTIDGPSGKPRGRRRVGPSKVLKLTPAARQAASRAVMDAIMAPLKGGAA